MRSTKTLVSVAALALSGLSTLIVSSPAQAAVAPDCQTVTTNVTNRHDHGLGGGDGNWAVLTFTRAVTICATPMEGGPWHYKATVADSGTFVTIAGPALSPGGNDAALLGDVPGTFEGGFQQDFQGPAGFLGLAPPVAVSGDTPTTSGWIVSLYAPAAAIVSGALYDWAWTYKTCVETWVDNEDTEDIAANPPTLTNDITGKPCPAEPTPTPAVPAAAALPVTGSSLTGLVVAGVAAVFLGALLVTFAVRRRARPQR